MITALLYADGNFVGPEYFRVLSARRLAPTYIITVGRFTDDQIAREEARTGGLWKPSPIPENRIQAKFDSMKNPELWTLIRDCAVDVVIQGGIGIVKPDMLCIPRIGFLNVHPGRLPEYRGNACPEWAVANGDEVHFTAHMIDEGIDSGPVILSQPYHVAPDWSYERFRAGLYAEAGCVLADALEAIRGAGEGWRRLLRPQHENNGKYHPAIPAPEMARVRAAFPGWQPRRTFDPIRPQLQPV